MHTRVVELDALADTVGAGPQDDDSLAFARAHLIFLVVGRIVVGRAGSELCGAGVHRFIDRMDTKGAANLAHRVFGQASHGRDLTVRETVALRLSEDIARQCFRIADARRDLVQEEHLVEEPWVDLGRSKKLLQGGAATNRLLDLDQASFGSNASGLDKRTRLLGGRCGAIPMELNTALVDGTKCLLQCFREATTDRHGLADGLHRRCESGISGRELLEGETRDLDDHIVECRLERGRGRTRDVVGDLVERVAGSQACGDLRDREARRLRGQS